MSRDDWPEMSYNGSVTADLERKGTAPPHRQVVTWRERECLGAGAAKKLGKPFA